MKLLIQPFIHNIDIISIIILITSLLSYEMKNKTKLFTLIITSITVLMIIYFIVRFPILFWLIIIPGIPPF